MYNKNERCFFKIAGDGKMVPGRSGMISMKDKSVCVIGLGYVGLPLAEAFSRHLKTIGFDIDGEKLEGLKKDNNEEGLEFTTDPARIREADFVLISVPTPVAKSKEPDLSYVKSAAEITGKKILPSVGFTRVQNVIHYVQQEPEEGRTTAAPSVMSNG